MESIEFKQTSNILLNAGIIGLHRYLEKYKENYEIEHDLKIDLQHDKLIVEGKELYKVLEDVYYLMGKDIYDTSGKKAREEKGKYYFIKEPFKAEPFYKMKSYGLAALISNDASPKAKPSGKSIKFDDLVKDDYEFASRIAHVLSQDGKKLKYYTYIDGLLKENEKEEDGKRKENSGGDSQIYVDDIYTKLPLLAKYNEKYFMPGSNICGLTGEGYSKLVDTTCTSPFITGASGIINYESFFKHKSRMISWKAMYLSRFSPVISLYKYVAGLDALVCYFFNSNSLNDLNHYFNMNKNFYKSEPELIEDNYMSNFKLYGAVKKDDENRKGS